MIAAAAAVLALLPGAAVAAERAGQQRTEADRSLAPTPPGQHGTLFGHLPPVEHNLEVVGGLEPTESQGAIVPDQIADLAVHKGFAYLNSWDDPDCTKGGTYVVDIRNPSNPDEIGFLPAADGYYHGEGAHVVTLDTPQFQGDLLAVNDEACSSDLTRPDDVPFNAGGFDLYDVSDPANPRLLVQNAGDFTADGVTEPEDEEFANSYHSVFVWQDGPRAFLVAVDNTEFADIDIFDITDPENPEFIRDFDPIFEFSEDIVDDIISESALGDEIFLHDMVVKEVGGQMRMIASYWDGGYMQLNVDDPANPQFITDTDFDEPDPLTGADPPEGNAHQAEYSHDNQFFLAADEDFASHRLDEFSITSGGDAGIYPSSVVPGAAPVSSLDDGVLNGPTYYGGYGCDASAPIPLRSSIDPELEAGEEAIIVLQRGPELDHDPAANPGEEGCFPGEKAENAVERGWDAVVIGNRHLTAEEGPDSAYCGSGDFLSPVVAVCTTHEALHLIFGQDPASHPIPYPPGHNPALGAAGEDVEATVEFDGWGYAHLYDAETSEELDAFAIPEALDERYSVGFGDLSIHEFATDPTENLGYVSYYSGGVRVLSFDREEGLRERGAWIGSLGSDFWGIEQFTTDDGQRLIAGSDRDYGLVILKYSGPGAPVRPSCSDVSASTRPGRAVRVPLECTDANGNPLSLHVADAPDNGALGAITDSSVTYTPERGFTGTDEFRYLANDGAANSPAATARVRVARPSNRFTMRVGKLRGRKLVLVLNVRSAGRLSAGLRARLPGAGAAQAARVVRLARATKRARRAGRVRVTLRLSKAKRRALTQGLRRSERGRVRGSIKVAFTPTGGTTRRSTRRIVFVR